MQRPSNHYSWVTRLAHEVIIETLAFHGHEGSRHDLELEVSRGLGKLRRGFKGVKGRDSSL